MDTRIKEAIRYLGYGKCAVDEPTLELIQASLKELDQISDVKFTYRIFELSRLDADIFQINHTKMKSENLSKNLQGCNEIIVFAITLGPEVDRRLRKYEISNIARAAIFQACGAAYLEEKCDQIQEQWRKEFKEKGLYLRPRFSPGYGDFSITYQKDVLSMLEAPKRIGLSCTESYMLTPTKSVTAVIGISSTDEQCHKSGCEVCDKADCLYKRS